MARYFGSIGFAVTLVVRPGVYEDVITERDYYGDIRKDVAKWKSSEHLHKNFSLSNTISIVGDAYAYEHVSSMRYVELSGALWSIAEVEIERPRLNIRLGDVYNGPRPE